MVAARLLFPARQEPSANPSCNSRATRISFRFNQMTSLLQKKGDGTNRVALSFKPFLDPQLSPAESTLTRTASVSPLQSALTESAQITPLESALTKKSGGRVKRSPLLTISPGRALDFEFRFSTFSLLSDCGHSRSGTNSSGRRYRSSTSCKAKKDKELRQAALAHRLRYGHDRHPQNTS
jgi:hypothetical protein